MSGVEARCWCRTSGVEPPQFDRSRRKGPGERGYGLEELARGGMAWRGWRKGEGLAQGGMVWSVQYSPCRPQVSG